MFHHTKVTGYKYIVYKEILLANKEQNSIQKWAKDKNKQFT